ncbi:MAG: hypothetical protein WBO46_10245 [Caldilineaceae bacterium]
MPIHNETPARSFLPAYLRNAPPLVRRNALLDLWGAMAYGVFFGAALQFIPVVLRNLGASTEMLALYTSQTYLGSILTSFSIIIMRQRRTKSFAVACWYAARAIFLFVGLVKQIPCWCCSSAFFGSWKPSPHPRIPVLFR